METNSNINMPDTTADTAPRDGQMLSAWQANIPKMEAAAGTLYGDELYDCLVIGAGITGMTAALLLQREGKKVLVADAHSPGFGTTGGTSAHINTFADTTYTEAKSAFGEEGAKLFAAAINEGLSLIGELADQYNIECDLEAKTGYLYAEDEEQVSQLDDIFEGAQMVGVPVAYTSEVPTPFAYQKALRFDGQTQFHPLKYLRGLQKAFLEAGGTLLENTLIDSLASEDGVITASAGDTVIHSKTSFYATHIPPKITSFSFRCAPYRSYVIGVKLENDNYPDALIYDLQEPYHYFRDHVINGEKVLLVGGDDHKTGHEDPAEAFTSLEEYVRTKYQVAEVAFRWSSQYYVPVDGFPYIGQMPEMAKGVYCATGYNGNGMMLGTIAGKIISDLVISGTSKYENIFSPSRVKPISGFTEFVKENADAAYHFVADRLSVKDEESLAGLANGNGKVVELDGKKIAAYRDEEGRLHTLNPVCTHAKCIVNWNPEEKSWDCPCHGARFDINGLVLTGPADKSLEQYQLENE